MIRKTVLATALALCTVSLASADVPPPPGITFIQPRLQFEGVGKYTDQVFFLKFKTGRNPTYMVTTIVEVKNSQPFTMASGRILESMSLFAVDRKEYDKLKAGDPKDWLKTSAPGILSTSIDIPSTNGSVKDKEVPVIRYRISIEGGKLTAPRVAAEKQQSEAPTGTPNWAVGVGIAFSLTALGQWLVRRRRTIVE